MSRFLFILVLVIGLVSSVFAQKDIDQKTLYKMSQEAFDKEAFATALPLLLKYDSLYPGDYEIRYRIGACYLNSEFERTKAIPYIEEALNADRKALPSIAFKDLGGLYHLAYRLEESAEMYREYMKMEPVERQQIEHLLYSLETAKVLMHDSLVLRIENIGKPVNTKHSEITPYVSADESILYYQDRETRDFYVAYYKDDKWAQKVKLDIPYVKNYQIVKFAGISPSGDQIFIQLGDSNNTDIYYGDNFLKTCNQLQVFDENINSPYHESSLSLSPDGNILYFCSDRPGGYGGFDIYQCEKDTNGKWGVAINLGPVINTEYDELFPFIHPSMQKMFFSSNGHQTMGGYDIFEVLYYDDAWQTVKNVGYPINTSFDELSYSMTAKGSSAYLFSTRNDKTNHFDIYKIYLKESIPLTLVKGKILAGDPPKPISAEIQVIDKTNLKPLKYIYNPNPQTGNYLMIFPPGKDYDMIIKAKGYKPYVINIYIPNQTYFYENFQEIILNPIRVNSLGETIGEEITVTNTFYDIYKNYNDSVAEVDSSLIKNYDELLNLVEKLIQTTDTFGLYSISNNLEKIDSITSNPDEVAPQKDYDYLFSLVEEAIETTDSTALRILDENSTPHISYQSRYFYYEEDENESFNPVFVNNDTIFAVRLLTDKLKERNNEILSKEIVSTDSIQQIPQVKNITKCSVYFNSESSIIENKYIDRLTEIAELIADNPNLYLRITGFSNRKEDPQVAVSRAIEVRSFMSSKGLDVEKTKTLASAGNDAFNKNNQKAELYIFESGQPIYAEGEYSSAVKLNQEIAPQIEDKQEVVSIENKEGYPKLAQFGTGVEYTVQIASGANFLELKDEFFKGKSDIEYYQYHHLYKYIIGRYETSGQAYRMQLKLIEEGFEGAFVVTFKNGVRVE
ncbi:MAG: PD40 domain-containing protein [Bacteroidales bacterium]|nr:PD40 domain-containing protein [Bacteroidales bacterium]